jgi:pimeloyl-[acyl-carrier protein] methyl ester esterase
MTRAASIAGAGPDLVLLHGWAMNAAVWDDVAPALASGMRVHTPNLPGHGGRADLEDATLVAAADALAEAIPDGAAVCGWSLGALLALVIARRYPKKVRRLVLVAATPRFVADDDWDHGMRAATLEQFAHDLGHDMAATLTSFVRLNALHGARGRPAIREFAQRLATTPPASETALRRGLAWLRETDLRIDAPWIAAPALVLHGARDAIVPVGAGRWLSTALPHASLVEWPDAAHLPFFTHREAFVAALEAFVA